MNKEQPSQNQLQEIKTAMEQAKNRSERARDAFFSQILTRTPEYDVRLASRIELANKNIARISDKLALPSAQLHKLQIESFTESLPKLREYTSQGHFPQEALEKREKEYEMLLEMGQDPLIVKGYDMIENQKVIPGASVITPPQGVPEVGKATPQGTIFEKRVDEGTTTEQERAPEAEINEKDTAVISFEGHDKKIQFIGPKRNTHIALLQYFGEQPFIEIPTKKLRQDLPDILPPEVSVGQSIKGLRDKIEDDPENPRILVTHGVKINAKYQLNARVTFAPKPSDVNTDTLTSTPSKEAGEDSEMTITPFDAATLCHLILAYRNTPINVGSDQLYPFADHALVQELYGYFEEQIDEYDSSSLPNIKENLLRQKQLILLNKLEKTLENGDLDKVMDKHDEKIQELLIWIYSIDQDKMDGHLVEFLKSMVIREKAYEEKRSNRRPTEWIAPRDMILSLQKKEEELDSNDMTQDSANAEDSDSNLPPAPVQTERNLDAYMSLMEKRDPKVRRNIENSLQIALEKVNIYPATVINISSGINLHARNVQKIIDNLKLKVVDKKLGHPVYDQIGVTLIQYSRGIDWKKSNLQRQEIEALKHIAIDVYKTYLEELANQPETQE